MISTNNLEKQKDNRCQISTRCSLSDRISKQTINKRADRLKTETIILIQKESDELEKRKRIEGAAFDMIIVQIVVDFPKIKGKKSNESFKIFSDKIHRKKFDNFLRS